MMARFIDTDTEIQSVPLIDLTEGEIEHMHSLRRGESTLQYERTSNKSLALSCINVAGTYDAEAAENLSNSSRATQLPVPESQQN